MCINIQQVSYTHPDKEVLFDKLSLSISKGQKIALIGNNGCGKSTLLQIIAGNLSSLPGTVSGTVTHSEHLYYVPQHFGQYNDMSIAQALKINHKLEALHAILNGSISDESLSILNDDWNIEERTLAALNSWGLADIMLSHSMKKLSGGERTRIFLAGMEIHSPSIILMDEPSNHLDNIGRERLYEFITKCRATLLIVSHDRSILNLMPETCELDRNQLTYYGGNYDFYKEQKAIQQNSLQKQLEEKEKELRQARKLAREVAERKDKQSQRGEKSNQKKGLPRILMGALKSKSEKSTAHLTGIHEDKSKKIINEREQLRSSLSPMSELKTDFNSSSLHIGKILVKAENINYHYAKDKKEVMKSPLSFQLRSGDRVQITGENGSGKTTLLKLIIGELAPTTGTLTRADFSHVYLNQEYSIIRNELNVLQQVEIFNTRHLPEHELKTILNRYLFPASVWNKPCSKLSGGEKMRLAFCSLMISNNTPDLFILDEPTNNLDIQNINIITATIKEYSGTVILVSHDRYFKEEIGINEKISL